MIGCDDNVRLGDRAIGPAGLAGDPGRLGDLLRSCVACGLCLPCCATYLASGNEAYSARGRLHLLGEVLGHRMDIHDRTVARAFDTCLDCMACTRFCPSGVSSDLFAHIRSLGCRPPRWRRFVDPASALIESHRGRSILHAGAWCARAVVAAMLGSSGRRRLVRAPRPLSRFGWVLGSLPPAKQSDRDLIRLLDRLFGPQARRDDACGSARSGPRRTWNAEPTTASIPRATVMRLRSLLNAHGCRNHPILGLIEERGRGPRTADKAGSAELLEQVYELLDDILPSRLASFPLQVAVHDPCRFAKPARIAEAARTLLARIVDLRILEPAEQTICCGGSWWFTVRYPDLSRQMAVRQAGALAATGCQLVVVADPDCLGRLNAGLAVVAPMIPAVSLIDLLWYTWVVP